MQPVRVITYNVRYFGHGTRGLASTATSMERIAAALASLEPLADIICLQEVETASLRSTLAHPAFNGETQLDRLMQTLRAALLRAGKQQDAYDAYYFPAHTYKFSLTPIYTTGLAVIARRGFEVSHHNCGQPHDITHRKIHPVKRLKQTRICAHLRVSHRSGFELDIFNTHLSLPTTLSREFWLEPRRMGWGPNQLEEAKNVARFVETEKRSDRWILVGDFNALPGSPVYRYLVEQAGFADAFALHYHFREEDLVKWPTAGFMNMRMHLDHMFAGRGLRFVDFDGTHRFGQKNGVFRGLSDHVPIVGSFTVL